ncbi:MAG: M48 family metallopeptidase [Gammaproteobacteria bacterium]|nr:M48 family metallopeptidase [Gammaproteobacteria bacterium]MBU2059607.1 M48 family metallopeptidase [Gammaproteobacteria bacterium]MBU2175741.1 M48 family metallopeptidase [Gammaproteobacteria bacterium]MBU2248079.1 M48 family metallopeptidase [Gammaproteobacteria bacterium]MBU2346000.1 M48 family metallopeptidase [Gammaproteobacteria bacterium]
MSSELPAYQLKFSARRRSVQLKIQSGQLWVSAPTGCDLQFIQQLIQQKKDWIDKHLSQQQQTTEPGWLAQRQIPLFDDKLKLNIVQDRVNQFSLDGDCLWLQLSSRNKKQSQDKWIEKLVTEFYLQQAKLWFELEVQLRQQQMSLSSREVRVCHFKAKWGSCDSSGVLSFNWRLLMAPAWVAQYVVVHELAHLVHMNHSKSFWALVSQFNQDAAKARLWLKQNQHWMQL